MSADVEHDGRDLSEPVQRRLWRRVWIGVVIFVLSMPVVLWFAIDWTGKRAWREVQERLRAKGEATTIEELDLPSREQVPDEENFFAIPWLQIRLDGTESEAEVAVRRQLEDFLDGDIPLLLPGDPGPHRAERPRDPRVELGFAEDIKAWARFLGRKEADASVEGAGRYVLTVSEHLWPGPWTDLEQALSKPRSLPVPLMSERLDVAVMPHAAAQPLMNLLRPLIQAMRVRGLAALAAGDDEMAADSMDIAVRLVEGYGGDGSLIGMLIAESLVVHCYDLLVQALWSERWQESEPLLRRAQETFERVDFMAAWERSLRIEMVQLYETIDWLRHERDSFGNGMISGGLKWEDTLAAVAPDGWFLNNMAYAADLFDRTLLETFRINGDFSERIASAQRIEDEITALNRLEEAAFMPVILLVSPTTTAMRRAAWSESRRRQAVTICALYRYRKAGRGRFPESLDALIPEFLDSVPLDPIDGEPMRYRLDEAVKGGFVLYSIGLDGVDDDGVLKLEPGAPATTRVHHEDYLGDWPWPVKPRRR